MFGSELTRVNNYLTRVNKRVTLRSKMARAGSLLRNPTMTDVATQSGVSRYTVSKVLNGSAGVSSTTRERVLDACQKLRFVTNHHAASLARGNTRFVGLVVTSIVDPFYGELIEAAEQSAFTLGHDIAYRCSYGDAERERRIASSFLGLKASALIVSPAGSAENLAFWRGISSQTPVVFIDHALLEGSHLVATDHHTGGRVVTQHLLERGVSPAYLGSSQPLSNSAIADRQRGYLDAMTEAGQAPVLIPVDGLSGLGDTERFGYKALSRYLQSGAAPRKLAGLWCATDSIAVGAMRALVEAGRHPGEDILVAGHDDLPFSAFLNPPLTTVRQLKGAIGERAMHAAVHLTSLKDFRKQRKIREILAPELVPRASTRS